MGNTSFPWIEEVALPDGRRQMHDTRTGELRIVTDEAARWAFIADHSSATPGKGLGDRVHDALDWAGFRRCMPCAERQATLNAVSNWLGAKSP